jgi:tetratricopeptide (TPR) repeat protein
LSADLLSLMNYFDRQGIPEAVLKVKPREAEIQDSMLQNTDSDHPDIQDEEDISETTSDDKFDEALECLLSYSLVSIRQDKGTFVMHGLVQLATRKWLEMQGTQERWKAQFCMKLNAVFPNGDYENWGLCEILFPHAKSAERQRPEDLLVQDWADILRKAAWYTWAKRDYREAERMCEKSVGALRNALGEEDGETLYSLGLLASIYGDQGRWTEAEKIEVQVVETKKRVLGEEHPSTLISMGNLASRLSTQGRWTEAEEIDVQITETMKRVLGEEHPDTLTSMHNLTFTMKKQGRKEEAVKLMTECFQLRERILGPRHHDTLSSAAALARWSNIN